MGSFQATCAISGLFIPASAKVRYMLLTQNPYEHHVGSRACYMHDWWFPRTFPLQAKYDECGSVMAVEAGPARDLWFDGLGHDLVEMDWGENKYHDLPTSLSMPFVGLLAAIPEGRLLVRFEADEFPKPDGTKDPVGSTRQKNLVVSHAMIREDIWQALLQLKLSSHSFRRSDAKEYRSVEDYYVAAKEFYKQSVEAMEDDMAKRQGFGRCFFALTGQVSDNPIWWLVGNKSVPFATGLATHWIHFVEKRLPEKEAEAFLRVVAEFAFIQDVLVHVRFMWHPSANTGPQFGEYKKHLEFLKTISNVALAAKKNEKD